MIHSVQHPVLGLPYWSGGERDLTLDLTFGNISTMSFAICKSTDIKKALLGENVAERHM